MLLRIGLQQSELNVADAAERLLRIFPDVEFKVVSLTFLPQVRQLARILCDAITEDVLHIDKLAYPIVPGRDQVFLETADLAVNIPDLVTRILLRRGQFRRSFLP